MASEISIADCHTDKELARYWQQEATIARAAVAELVEVIEAYLDWGNCSPVDFEQRQPRFAARDGTGGVTAIDAFARSLLSHHQAGLGKGNDRG